MNIEFVATENILDAVGDLWASLNLFGKVVLGIPFCGLLLSTLPAMLAFDLIGWVFFKSEGK